jgi:hypothetical protein
MPKRLGRSGDEDNKDLLECVGDTFALLEKLHIY